MNRFHFQQANVRIWISFQFYFVVPAHQAIIKHSHQCFQHPSNNFACHVCSSDSVLTEDIVPVPTCNEHEYQCHSQYRQHSFLNGHSQEIAIFDIHGKGLRCSKLQSPGRRSLSARAKIQTPHNDRRLGLIKQLRSADPW